MKVFEILNKIDISKYQQEINGFSYLPWAIALKIANESLYKVEWEPYVFCNGKLAIDAGVGMIAGAQVTLQATENSDRVTQAAVLPVLDFQNNSMVDGPPLDCPISRAKTKRLLPIKSSDINKTIMRSLVKALAYCGLGWSLYSKEDIVDEVRTGPEQDIKETGIQGIPWGQQVQPQQVQPQQVQPQQSSLESYLDNLS